MVTLDPMGDRYLDNLSQGGMFCRLSDDGVIQYPMYACLPKEMAYDKNP